MLGGLFNDIYRIYRDPWALTYAGQIWTEIAVGGDEPVRISDARKGSESPLQ